MAAIGAGHFAAQPRRGKHLAGIAQARADRTPTRTRCISARSSAREHRRHVLRLVGADAVLAGQRAAGVDAVGEDLRRHLGRLLRLARNRARRNRSADAGCRRRRETRCRCEAPIALELRGCGSAPPAAASAARRRPGRSSSARRGPSPRTPPCGRARSARAARRSARLRSSSRRLAGRSSTTIAKSVATSAAGPSSSTISTASASGKFGMHRGFGGAGSPAQSIISTAAGMMPAPMMSDTAPPPASIVSNAGEQRLHRFGPAQDPHRHLRDDRERAFRSDEQPEQIRAGRVDQRAAEVHDLPVGQHGLDAEHVVHGEAVLEAVRAAGVLGDVAADRADLLARGIGRVVVAERRDLPRDLEVGHAGLDRDALVRDVDVEDAIEARQRDDDAAGHRQRAARQPGAVAARDERHLRPRAELDDGLHLSRGRRENDGARAFREGEPARRIRRSGRRAGRAAGPRRRRSAVALREMRGPPRSPLRVMLNGLLVGALRARTSSGCSCSRPAKPAYRSVFKFLAHAPSQYNPHIPGLLEGSWASARFPAGSFSKAAARR